MESKPRSKAEELYTRDYINRKVERLISRNFTVTNPDELVNNTRDFVKFRNTRVVGKDSRGWDIEAFDGICMGEHCHQIVYGILFPDEVDRPCPRCNQPKLASSHGLV